MDETGRAVFKAIADWAQLRREAKRTAKDLKDTRQATRELNDSFDDLDKSGDSAGKGLRKVGDSAQDSNKQVKGLLGSMQQWARIKAKATLGLDATKAKADIQRIKDDLAGFRVTKLQLDADAAQAKRELNEVQGELTRLRTQPTSAKVDADIAAALVRIDELKARLASIRDARMRVDADTAGAKAKLAAVSREADQVGRKRPTVKVDADTSKLRTLTVVLGAIAAAAALIGPVVGAVTALAAGLFSVASAAAPAVGGLLGVAAAAGAVAQAVGVAAIALSGVGKAVKALQAKQASAGSSAGSSAKQQEAAADRIAAAQRGVERAIEQRNRTAIQGQQAVEAAERGVASAVESSARRIASAERAHADAVRDVERARADLNRELELAKERMKDLALAAEGGVLDEEAATIRLQRAQQDLARVRRLGGSGLDLQEAQLGVKQAERDLKVIRESNADLAKEVQKAAATGVEGDDQVVAARERVAEATQGVQDAEEELTQARKDGRAEVEDAERQLAQTIQQTAWANADAQAAVTDALREQTQAYRDAAQAAETGGGAAAADDFDKASPAAQRFARFLNDVVLPALHKVRDAIQERALPKFQTAIETALPLLDLFGGKLGDTADIIGNLSIRAAQMMTSGPWTRDFGTILDSNNRIIETLGSAGLVAMDALRILWVVAGPLAERLALLVLHGLETARAFLEAKRSSGELSDFMTRAGNVIEQLLHIIGNFLVSLWNIGKAAAPAGQILLDSLEAVTKKFREFTGSAEGQNKMRQYFLDTVPTVQELGRLVVDLVKFFIKLGSDPNTAKFIEQLRTQLLPALDRMITTLGDGVVPKLIDFIKNIAELIAHLGGGALVGFLVTLNGIAEALNAILSIPGVGEFVGLILMLSGSAYALGLVGRAISGVAGTFRLLSPAVDLAVTGFEKLRDNFAKTSASAEREAKKTSGAWKTAGLAIAAVAAGMALDAAFDEGPSDKKRSEWSAGEEASDAADTAGKALSLNLTGVLDKVKRDINTIPDDVQAMSARWGPVWDSTLKTLRGLWDGFIQGFKDAGNGIGYFFTDLAPGFVQGAIDMLSRAGEAVTTGISTTWDTAKQRTSEAWDWCKQKISDTWDSIYQKATDAGNSVNQKVSETWESVKGTTGQAWDWAGQKIHDAWEWIKQTASDGAGGVGGSLDGLARGAIDGFNRAWDRAGQIVSNAWNGIKQAVQSAVSFIEQQIARVEAAWNRVKSTVGSGLSTAASYIPGFATGGMVGGTGNGDNQIIKATAGEWVVPKDVTARFLPFLKAITFGSLRSVTQIVQPEQARMIQDRLAGVPDLSQLAGLRELLTSARGASTTTVDNSDNSRGVNVVTNIYNPIAEPASDSVADRMRTLSLMGAFS